MVMHQAKYDQQQKPLPYICDACGDECNSITHFLTGENICDDCKPFYLESNAGEFVADFVEQHQRERLDYYWNGMTESERYARIQAFYDADNRFRQSMGDQSLEMEQVNFCLEYDGFLKFVEARLV